MPAGYQGYTTADRLYSQCYVREKFGTANVYYNSARTVLTPASGFIASYDFTLNPYRGCQYGCSYCYAVAFSPNRQMRQDWGGWVVVKQNAEDCLHRDLRRWYNQYPDQPPRIYVNT